MTLTGLKFTIALGYHIFTHHNFAKISFPKRTFGLELFLQSLSSPCLFRNLCLGFSDLN